MDYEKKYKQLHTLISDLYPFMSEYCKEKVEGFFPELKEDSEDEKIRKEIINYFECQSKEEPSRKDTHNKWIAWLEKVIIPNHSDIASSFIEDIKNVIDEAPLLMQSDKEKMIAWLEKQGEQKVSYTTTVETGNGGINALVTRELSTNGCDDEQKPADKVKPIVVRDFNSVFSREQIEEIDKRIEESQRLYNAKLIDAMQKVKDFPMTN